MMFRGKRLDNGKWITDSETFIHDGDGVWLSDATTDVVKIDPETFGQYVGLDDVSKKMAYSGDIVRFTIIRKTPGYYKDIRETHIGVISYNRYGHSCIMVNGDWEFHIDNVLISLVIGNIYDNPELLNTSRQTKQSNILTKYAIKGGNMKYSDTGQFTPTQKKLAKEIAVRLARLRKTGCWIVAKSDSLNAYMENDIAHSVMTVGGSPDYVHPIPFLDCGKIQDAGADDEDYFEVGFITED